MTSFEECVYMEITVIMLNFHDDFDARIKFMCTFFYNLRKYLSQ